MSTAMHPVAPEEIMALLDAELTTERAQVVTAHLGECSECGEVATSLRASSQSLTQWTVSSAPANPQSESGLFATAQRVASERQEPGASAIKVFFRRHWLVSGLVTVLALFMFQSVRLKPTSTKLELSHAEWGAGSGAAQSRSYSEPTVEPYNSADESKAPVKPSRSGVADSGEVFKETPRNGSEMQEPMIARSVSLSLVAKDFAATRTALDAMLARHHGYAANLTAVTQENVPRSLHASLRIPAGELTAAVAELKTLGLVQNETRSGEEVTQQHADLVARLRNSRETERRLQAILEQRTGKITDVLEVEQEIAGVRGQIERLEAEQRSLEHRVTFAQVELSIAEEYKAQITPTSPATSVRIHNAVVAGYRDATETLISILLFLAEYGPTLLIWLALLAPIAWFVRRRWLRASGITSTLGV